MTLSFRQQLVLTPKQHSSSSTHIHVCQNYFEYNSRYKGNVRKMAKLIRDAVHNCGGARAVALDSRSDEMGKGAQGRRILK